MIANIIRWSLHNRALVLLLAAALLGTGLYALRQTPLDAIPDLSDVQVIVHTKYPGQAPRVIEDQVTYPLTTAFLSVPGATSVRGYSFFGDSYVYVLFEEGTDLYWARSRVLEYLSQVADRLPEGARSALGPDATGVGWVYEYALVDRTAAHDLAQLRAIQDWFLKYELQTVPGVSEVATLGGMVKQYQVVVDPSRLRAYGLDLGRVTTAIRSGNQETGGSVIEMAEAEYMVRATGYIRGISDLVNIPLGKNVHGTPILLRDVANIRLGPQLRRGIAELNGEGEVVGGIVVMRFGENALATIEGVKAKLAELRRSLPDGVEIVETYDRSGLILRAVHNLQWTLVLQFIIVALVCALFLFHLRSSLVIVISLPLGVLAAFVIMNAGGINANIMSLGGIAIAIGSMVDAAIVLIENLHKHLARQDAAKTDHWEMVNEAAGEVGPTLFFSLLIMTLSFAPVFTLEAQEGRMFSPLALTWTFALAGAAALAVTLVPVLMGYFIRGHIRPETRNPLNRILTAIYRPALNWALRAPWAVIFAAGILVIASYWPISQLGSEFMPELYEGDLMYMPTTDPGISADKARQLLQQTDKMIRTVPEVEQVFGKIGRAETATDPAPLTMMETVIRLKPREQWRPGLNLQGLIDELDRRLDLPGLTNAWVMPIKTRIDMLSTGIKTPVGIKISGPELITIQDIGAKLETALKPLAGTASVYAERVVGGRYLEVEIDREKAARYGLNIRDVQAVIGTLVGGMNVSNSIEGLERYPINLRYTRESRDSLAKLRDLPIVTPVGAQVSLSQVADVRIVDGPGVIKSENARPTGWVFVDVRGRDIGSYVETAKQTVAESVELPPGYAISWSGQYEYMVRAMSRLRLVVPVTLGIIVFLLYLNFGRWEEVAIVISSLPLALIGGFWALYLLDYNLSVAVGVGFIALAGVSVELATVLLVYLNLILEQRIAARREQGEKLQLSDLHQVIVEGALLRVRPIMMTVVTVFAGLLPIMLSAGTGAEVMRRIATPMLGGMSSAIILTLLVVPAVFLLWKRQKLAI